MRVFISYSTKDGILYAKKLCEVLSHRGHDPFLADHDVCVSEIIWDEIFKEIKNRERSIFVLTESSRKSRGQKREYDYAVAKYKEGFAFISDKASKMEILDNCFPALFAPKGLNFNDNNFEEKCETISANLVKLQDKERLVQKKEIGKKKKPFPQLTLDGLDRSEIEKCISNLSDSYQMETVIPDAFSTNEADELAELENIGFNFRLPREWFLSYDVTHTVFSNEHLFRQFGRSIALGERKYLNTRVMSNENILHIEGRALSAKDLFEKIDEAISVIEGNRFKPSIIFPTIDHRMKMRTFSRESEKTHLKYSNLTPRPTLDTSLIINGKELKLISPLGKIPTNSIVFGKGAVRWLLKRYPKFGALHVDMGNDRLYPKKFVQVVAITTIRCEIDPKGIVVINANDEAPRQN